jgi:hypothetical protein
MLEGAFPQQLGREEPGEIFMPAFTACGDGSAPPTEGAFDFQPGDFSQYVNMEWCILQRMTFVP